MIRLPPEIENDLAAHFKIKKGHLRVNEAEIALAGTYMDCNLTGSRGRDDETRFEMTLPAAWSRLAYEKGIWRGWWPSPLSDEGHYKTMCFPCIVVSAERVLGQECLYQNVLAWCLTPAKRAHHASDVNGRVYRHGVSMVGCMFLHQQSYETARLMGEHFGAKTLGVKP